MRYGSIPKSVSFVLCFIVAVIAMLSSSGEKAAFVTLIVAMTGGLVLIASLPNVREFAIGPVKAKLVQVQQEITIARDEIAELFALSMSDKTFSDLVKLNDGRHGHYYLDPGMIVGLGVELEYLKLVVYIRFDKVGNMKGVEDLPRDENTTNLSEFISVTPQGQRFIELRQCAVARVQAKQRRLLARNNGE